MKLFLVLILIGGALSANQNSFLITPGEITIDSLSADNNRIAAGVAAIRGENLDYCYINVQFIQKQQLCGCFIAAANWVATSARCVMDPQEGRATNITVTIYGLSGRSAIRSFDRLVIPNGQNGADVNNEVTLEEFDATMDIPFSKVATGNVAMIRLTNPLTTAEQARVRIYTPVAATDWDSFQTAYGVNHRFRVCGFGIINNQGVRPRVLQCTDVKPISLEKCRDDHNADIPDESICLEWPDRENNVCPGDYGGPVWAYMYNEKVITQHVACITVGSPNIRLNSPCQGGHAVVCEFLPVKVNDWIQGVINNRMVF